MDRNSINLAFEIGITTSLSARRAWIEIDMRIVSTFKGASLSARRAWIEMYLGESESEPENVALRKESVDRNKKNRPSAGGSAVALRKESVDRNCKINTRGSEKMKSLSARRAWIEILGR